MLEVLVTVFCVYTVIDSIYRFFELRYMRKRVRIMEEILMQHQIKINDWFD